MRALLYFPLFFLMLAGGDAAGGEVLVDIQFAETDEAGSEATLPSGWEDDSGTRFSPGYSVVSDEEEKYLKVEYRGADRGPLVLFTELEEHREESFFTVTLVARAEERVPLGVGVRTRLPPHEVLAAGTIELEPERQHYEVSFSNVATSEERIEFYLEVPALATVELDSLRVERAGRQEAYAAVLEEVGGPIPGNLMAVTRFPLGLQSGVSLDWKVCDSEEVRVRADEDVPGPSRSPSLRIEAKKDFYLAFPPFDPPVRFDAHHASLYLRGEGTGRVAVVADGQRLRAAEFTAAPGRWKRVGLSFRPATAARFHVLVLEGKGDLWIDGLQVSHGDQPGAYGTQGAAEVDLALFAEADAAAARVLFEEEEAVVEYAVTGDAQGAVLKAAVYNLDGQVQALPDQPLDSSFLQRGRLDVDLFPGRPLGSFRLEAWVEDADGRELSPRSELVFHRLRRPRHWGEPASSGFLGIEAAPARRHLQMAKAAGIDWVRLGEAALPLTGWYHLEREKGRWSFEDESLERYREHGMRILGSLATAPEWASRLRTMDDPLLDRFYQPKKVEEFANYASVMVERYGDWIRHWEVWDRAWRPRYWAAGWKREGDRGEYLAGETSAQDYLRLQEAISNAIEAADPDLTLVGPLGATAPGWTRQVLADGGRGFFDVAGYHLAGDRGERLSGGELEERFRALDGLLKEEVGEGERPPVWVTDAGLPDGPMGNGLYRHTTLREEHEADLIATAGRLQRYVLRLRVLGAEKIFLPPLIHETFGAGGERGLLTEDGYLHPAAAALSSLGWHLDGADFAGAVDLGDHLQAYLFEREEQTVAVLALEAGESSDYKIPEGGEIEAEDCWGNPLEAGSVPGETLIFLRADATAAEMEELLSSR